MAEFIESGKLMKLLLDSQRQLSTAERRAQDADVVLPRLTTACLEKIRTEYERK